MPKSRDTKVNEIFDSQWTDIIIGTAFNLIRILALGVAIGYGYKRQHLENNKEVCK